MSEIPAERYDEVYSANHFAGKLPVYVTHLYTVGWSVMHRCCCAFKSLSKQYDALVSMLVSVSEVALPRPGYYLDG